MLAFLAPPVVVSAVDDAHYFWRWTDGSRAHRRAFADPGVGIVDLPGLLVASEPAVRGRIVVLQFRDDRGWHTEDVARTDERGVAVVSLNPYCADGGWCDRALDYRLRVDGQDAAVRVTFGG